MPNKPLKIVASDADSLLQLFSKKKKEFDPYLLAVLLNKLSNVITNEALHQYQTAILAIIQFSHEEFDVQLFNTTDTATLFNALAKWPSLMAEPLCVQAINNFLPYITQRAYAFKAQSISTIFNALSKYLALTNLPHSDPFKETINTLLNASQRQRFGPQDILLMALAFCYFTHFQLIHFDAHQKTIVALLKQLNLKELDPIAINQLQQIFIYAPELIESAMDSWNLSHLSREAFTAYLETHGTIPEKPESSLLHREVFHYLKKSFPKQFFGKVFSNEYKIGHTFVDIACPEIRLCIQVNGPYHYIGQKKQARLNNKSQFTQHLLEKQHWTVLTIKYNDWQTISNNKKKTYLRKILGPYVKKTIQTANSTTEEPVMPSPYSVMQQQIDIQKQQLDIQKQLLEMQQPHQHPATAQHSAPTAPVYFAMPPPNPAAHLAYSDTPSYPIAQGYYPIMPSHPVPVYYTAIPGYPNPVPVYYSPVPLPHPMAQGYYPIMPSHPAPVYYSAPGYPNPVPVYYSPVPLPHPMAQYPAADFPETQPPPEAAQLANTNQTVGYDRHTNLFKPTPTQATDPAHSDIHLPFHHSG